MKLSLLFLALPLTALAQGPLTPPSAPAPTMKTLDQIEPRIPIPSDAAPPYVISGPGSYYLTSNILCPSGQDCIQIQSEGVTLDLNGFSVISVGPGSGGTAISTTKRAMIKNGFIKGGGVTSSATYSASGFGYGVFMESSGSVTDVIIDGCKNGIYSDSSVNRCKVTNAESGIRAAEVVQSVAVDCSDLAIQVSNSCTDSVAKGDSYGIYGSGNIDRCYGLATRLTGIMGRNVSHSIGFGSTTGITASENVSESTGVVTHSSFSGATLYGIKATGTVSNSKGTCTATSGIYLQMFGIQCDSAMNCTATSAGNGIRAFANVTNSYGKADNGGKGIWVDGTASFCRGDHTSSTGTAIQAAIAVACTYANGTISANKQLGTP